MATAFRHQPWAAALATALGLGLGTPAAGFVIEPGTYAPCLGQSRCTLGAATLIAQPTGAVLAQQIDTARGSVRGLGIAHDAGNGFNEPELQGAVAGAGGERLEILFDAPHRIDVIILAHLFGPDRIAADPEEQAVLEAFGASGSLGRITVTSRADGTIAASGPVAGAQRVSAEAGVTYLKEPFLAAEISRLVFSSAAVESGDSSDYSISRIDLAPVAGAAD